MTPLLLWAQSNKLLSILGSLAIVYLLREIFLRLTIKHPFVYYVFLFPGVILHEISHLVFCLITFAKIRDIKLFSKTGGFVEHENSKIPFVGNFLISIAPLLIGSVGIYYLSNQLPQNFIEIISSVKSIAIFYFLISILITFFPSRQDISNSPILYIVTTVILGFALVRFDMTSAFKVYELTSISAIIALTTGIVIFFLINRLKWK